MRASHCELTFLLPVLDSRPPWGSSVTGRIRATTPGVSQEPLPNPFQQRVLSGAVLDSLTGDITSEVRLDRG
jgi:hypothetical protein